MKNLRKATLTLGNLSVLGFRFSQYRIEFKDENGAIKSVKFWNPSGEIDSLKQFQKVVRKHKKGFKVKFSASTFDQ